MNLSKLADTVMVKVKVHQSHYRPWVFQEIEAPRFQDNRHIKLVRFLALRTGRLYPQEIFLVLISVGGWVDLRAIVRPEGWCQWKISVTPSGYANGSDLYLGGTHFEFRSKTLAEINEGLHDFSQSIQPSVGIDFWSRPRPHFTFIPVYCPLITPNTTLCV
jgi:hypothetical protein